MKESCCAIIIKQRNEKANNDVASVWLLKKIYDNMGGTNIVAIYFASKANDLGTCGFCSDVLKNLINYFGCIFLVKEVIIIRKLCWCIVRFEIKKNVYKFICEIINMICN